VISIRIHCEIVLDETEIVFDETEANVRKWIKDLKEGRDREQRQIETNQETENRRAKIVAAKAPALWAKVVAEVKAQVQELRSTFPDDPSMNVECLDRDRGFTIRRNGYPYISVEAFWVEEIGCPGVYVHTQRSADGVKDTKQKEIAFRWASEDTITMIFEDQRHTLPDTLSEQILRKIVDYR
jgi:hypothetical protein